MEPDPSRNELWSALLAAFGGSTPPPDLLPKFQQAACSLLGQGATPHEIARRAGLMRQAYSVPLTPTLLAKNFLLFGRPAQPPTGVFAHPDRCPSPCIGCAADRKAAVNG